MEEYISFALYLIILFGVGIVAYFSTKSYDDYVLGGRKVGGFLTAMSACAADMSGWLLLGLPGAIYTTGLSKSWIVLGLTVGAFWNYRIVAGRLRIFTEKYGNAVTLPDFFSQRFPDTGRLLKIFCAVFTIFFFIIYCASGIVGAANLFTNFLGLDYIPAMFFGALATLLYAFVGGYLAVTWSDAINASLMIFTLLLAPTVVIINYGWDNLINVVNELSIKNNIPYSNFLFNVSGISIFSALAWGLGYFGQPHILAKFMAADSLLSIKRARRIGITWMFLCLSSACLIGYFGLAYFSINNQTINQPETVFIQLSQKIFNPWIVGIVISAILAAIISTLSTQLIISSTSLTEDFYKEFIHKNASSKELIWVGRFMIIVVAILAIIIAWNPNSQVMDLVSNAWAGFGATFGPAVIFSLFSRSVTGKGTLIAMIAGGLTVVLWQPVTGFFGWTDLQVIYEMVPGFIFSSFILMCSSLFGKQNEEITAKFDDTYKFYQKMKSGSIELESLE